MIAERTKHIPWFFLALVLWAISAGLAAWLYCGFGLADDVNDVHIVTNFLESNFTLNPDFAHDYRLVMLYSRALLFSHFGVGDITFITPIFIAVTLLHFFTIVVARNIFGNRAAFLVALLICSTPYEILISTLNAMDSVNGLAAILAAGAAYRGYYENRPRWMILSAFATWFGLLNKVSGLGITLLAALATLLLPKKMCWRWYWITLSALIGMLCVADFFYSHHLFHWITYNNFYDGFDASDRLLEIWSIFPQMIFTRSDNAAFLFGVTGWLALLGSGVCCWRIGRHQAKSTEYFLFLFCIFLVLLINFAPHKLTFSGYYSHIRVSRYLVFASPAILLLAGYVLDEWTLSYPTSGFCFVGLCAIINFCAFPAVLGPYRDAHGEGRQMIHLLRKISLEEGDTITADDQKCMRISAIFRPHLRGNPLRCFQGLDMEKKRDFLAASPPGIVITGGAVMPNYGSRDQLLNLTDIPGFPPSSWKKIETLPGEIGSQRTEPLTFWRVPKIENQQSPSPSS